MSMGQGGLDPRITGPASLAGTRTSEKPKGIPLILDEEAERRQLASDISRRRRQKYRRLLLTVSVLIVAVVALLSILSATLPAR